jgi:hypothetical protein
MVLFPNNCSFHSFSWWHELQTFFQQLSDTNLDQFWIFAPAKHFCIDATYEMRTTEYSEICISIDTHTVAERAYKGNGKWGKKAR